MQVKLLRALQDGEIDPVGARRPLRVDFRLISATNRSLIDLVKAGIFREDLYYRLNVFPIRVPPLRERREDIPELVRHFTARFAAEEGKTGLRGVTAPAIQLLTRHNWPGNVRQLENAVFRAVVLADGPMLTPDEFPQITAQLDGAPPLRRNRRRSPPSRSRSQLPARRPPRPARALPRSTPTATSGRWPKSRKP